ncbi:MAG TPA: hypothetical protein PK083_04205 [Soehngenia sp.]|nr:hypothetical protein [Soehngenia sp.]HPP31646.1 hypothetical protein [Soehngenia sp.]
MKHLSNKHFYILVILCSVIILLSSLELMIIIKDSTIFNKWVITNNLTQYPIEDTFVEYLNANLISYTLRIIFPVALGISAFLTLTKFYINKILVYVFLLIELGGLTFTAIQRNFNSLFYFLILSLYVVLIVYTYIFIALKEDYN